MVGLIIRGALKEHYSGASSSGLLLQCLSQPTVRSGAFRAILTTFFLDPPQAATAVEVASTSIWPQIALKHIISLASFLSHYRHHHHHHYLQPSDSSCTHSKRHSSLAILQQHSTTTISLLVSSRLYSLRMPASSHAVHFVFLFCFVFPRSFSTSPPPSSLCRCSCASQTRSLNVGVGDAHSRFGKLVCFLCFIF